MVDMGMIAGAVGTLKTALDIAGTVKEMNDLAVIRNKVIEMQNLIMSAQGTAVTAQSQMLEMVHEIAELKAKLAEAEEWKAIADRYQLRDYGNNTLAYELKEGVDGEPHHRICPVCFEQRRKSILQFRYKTHSSQDKFRCIPCGADFEFGVYHAPQYRKPERNWIR
ncbi:hypothetical protein N181_09790 [Sinorhizobium fredii USDA 205]|uniref:Uncharacterized protein n=1 Tax=Rhizobium fredii TaxID=380 RepID=A0A844A6A4_RHIFR|nr:hypothetical protein [Sinorhizobium fredii]KSV90951.1 hypothetical protein N181_09790 [Sinorhizobium fredii USDA 205]MQX08654.1 hypothetical protein [Sinorhizobium fredii]GEC30521.1 hypothetical protein EFR01_06920 [Sinorhizobium fredii]GLS09718.1 hypothetical protein GCM10007864_33490 [Sinorhizobium fredii]